MSRAETCSCSLCNKFYTYIYRHKIVLDKYIQSNLVYCLIEVSVVNSFRILVYEVSVYNRRTCVQKDWRIKQVGMNGRLLGHLASGRA